MRTVGIICECNPFHQGHRYLIEQARSSEADAVICVMSGCFTQRGEAAVLDPKTRARMLLDGGADAVFELPFPFSSSGAEFFADAGVSMLDRLGVDELWFGSECGDLKRLQNAANLASEPAFSEHYRTLCQAGNCGTAEAYFQCLRAFGMSDAFSSNDILGISYLKAIQKRASRMYAATVQRVGSAFHSTSLREGEFPSAAALREMLKKEGLQAWEPFLTEHSLALVRSVVDAGDAPFSLDFAQRAILTHFRLASAEHLESTAELAGGLGRRIAEVSRSVNSLSDLICQSVTKKYTEARVRRGILFSMLGVTASDLRREPAYAVLLAANERGCAFLKNGKHSFAIPVVTAHSSVPQTPDAKAQAEMTERVFALYTLCSPSGLSADAFLRASSYIEGKS